MKSVSKIHTRRVTVTQRFGTIDFGSPIHDAARGRNESGKWRTQEDFADYESILDRLTDLARDASIRLLPFGGL